MLNLLKIILIINISFCCLSFSQTIESVQIKGSKNFSKDDLTGWAGIKKGDKYTPAAIDSIKYRLARNLSSNGYFHSMLDEAHVYYKPDSLHINIEMSITEGEPTYTGKIFFTGLDSSASLRVLPNFMLMEGKIFNKYELENNISRSLTYFENNGYPFAKINILSVFFYKDTVKDEYMADIHLELKKEVLSKINRVEIAGNTSTKDYVIARELKIRQGEEYSQKVIDRIPAKLNRLGYFEPVGTPDFFLNSKNEGILRINVKEKVTNSFDGIIGYVPGTGTNQSGYITGLVNVSMKNLFGTGRAFSINWQQYNRSSQDLELKYLEPWLFDYPFNFTVDIFQRKQDSTYVQRKFEGSLEYLATENMSAAFTFSTESVIPSQSDSTVFTVFNSGAVTTGLNVKVDTRDDPYAPTSGIKFATSYSISRKKIYGPAKFITPDISTKINLQRFTLDLDLFYELFERQVAALGIHGRELRSSFFEASDLYRLGGANSLRGYLEDQFLGNRITWTNLEYRLLLTNRTYGFVFFDTGYFLRDAEPLSSIEKIESLKTGYGLGFNIETGLGVLKVSFAMAQGDSFTKGKIHFGIVNDF